MVRSIWMRTVLGMLASAGLVLGQQAAAPSTRAAEPAVRTITVTEMGKPGQKCKVLKEWRADDGSLVRQVEALDTGERMTIIETGVLSTSSSKSGGQIKSVASRIFHWGRSPSAPPGTPMPPLESEAPPIATVNKGKDGKSPAEKHDGAATKVEPPASPYAPTRVESKDGHPTPTTDQSRIANAMPASPNQPTVVQSKDASGSYTITRPVWNQGANAPTTSGGTGSAGTPQVVTTQPAQPSNWRQSWGSLDDSGKPTKKDKTSKKQEDKTVVLNTNTKPTEKPKSDPLVDPLPYTKVGAEEKINEKMKTPEHKIEPLSGDPVQVAKGHPEPLPPLPPLDNKTEPLPPLPPLDTKTEPQPPPPAKVDKPSLPAKAKDETVPVGAQSVILAGGDPKDIPAPLVKMPETKRPSPPQQAKDSRGTKKYADDDGQVNAFTPPPSGPGRPDSQRKEANQPYASKPGYGGYGMPAPTPVGPGLVQANYEAMPGMDQKTQDYLRVLKDSIYPSQREWAAEQVSACDWRKNEAVVDALVAAAKEDPAATVRAGCVRCLTKMKVNTVPVVVAMQGLKADADPRVRTEVDEALSTLAPGLPLKAAPVPESETRKGE